MAADPLQNVATGDPLILRADSINAWNDAARRSRLDKYSGGAVTDLDEVFPAVTVVVRNDTGADLPVRSVVYLSDWIVSPVTYPLDVSQRPILKAITPTATTNAIGILRDAVPDGEMGRAIISGCAVVDVLVNDSNHTYAVPISADSTRLGSATSGPAKIIKWESSGTTRRAIVLVGDGNAGAEIIDLSGRTGSIADVTALQILRGVISGTAGAAVFTPDLASSTLPGIISSGGGIQTIDMSLGIKTQGGICFDPLGSTGHGSNDGHVIGVSTDFPDWICVWRDLGLPSSDAPDGYLRAYQLRADGQFNINGTNGASGTDPIGNVFEGGIVKTIGGSNLSVSGSVAFTGDISPAQLTANTNDWNPSGW